VVRVTWVIDMYMSAVKRLDGAGNAGDHNLRYLKDKKLS